MALSEDRFRGHVQCHLVRLVVEGQFGISANASDLPSSAALVFSDLRERIEVNFHFLFCTQIWPGFRHWLGSMDVPHHRVCACIPTVHPTNDTAPICPDQICDREALTFIIVHYLQTFCAIALYLRHKL